MNGSSRSAPLGTVAICRSGSRSARRAVPGIAASEPVGLVLKPAASGSISSSSRCASPAALKASGLATLMLASWPAEPLNGALSRRLSPRPRGQALSHCNDIGATRWGKAGAGWHERGSSATVIIVRGYGNTSFRFRFCLSEPVEIFLVHDRTRKRRLWYETCRTVCVSVPSDRDFGGVLSRTCFRGWWILSEVHDRVVQVACTRS